MRKLDLRELFEGEDVYLSIYIYSQKLYWNYNKLWN